MQSTLIPDNQSPTVIEPGKTSFDAPTFSVTCRRKARRLTTLSAAFVFARRNARFDSAFRQLASEGGTVKSFVCNQLGHSGSGSPAFLFFDGNGCQRPTRQTNFVRLRARAEQANRQSVAVRHEHYFTAFSNLGAPDSIAPFLDGTNEPSRKAAAHSILPSRSRLASNVRHTSSHTPNCDHSSNLRQQVVGEPYSSGKSAHAQPTFRTYKMPFKHWRCAVVRVLVSAMAKAFPALAIGRRSNRVGS